MMRATLLVLLLGAGVAAQQPRDVTSPSVSGDAELNGVVVSDDAVARPVPGAVVTVTGDALRTGRSMLTDEAGRFAFTQLPAGSVSLSADKPAYLKVVFGASRAGGAGSMVALAAGQRVAGITLRLARGAAIAGVLSDESGRPIRDARVLAARADSLLANGNPALTRAVATDDRGAYRLYGLQPGDYIIAATVGDVGNGQTERRSTEEVDAILQRLQQRGRPPAPGTSNSNRAVVAPTPARRYGVAPAFYPGTNVVADAQEIRVVAGEERTGIDFVARQVPTATLDGVVIDPVSPRGSISMVINRIDAPFRIAPGDMSLSPMLTTPVGPDGRFRYANLAPGHYSIVARRTVAPPGLNGASAGPQPQSDASASYAMAEVTVNGDDVAGISLILQPAMRFSGRVVLDIDQRDANPIAFQELPSIELVRDGVRGALTFNGTTTGAILIYPAKIRPDGAFEILGIVPGRYSIPQQPTAPTFTWWMRSVIVDGRDVLDVPIEFGQSGDVTGAVVTWTNRHSELTGTLQSASGAPLMDYVVLVFPKDRAMWRPGARRVKSMRPGTDGRFSFRDLPAGEYLLSALTDLDPAEAERADFLDQVVPAALPVVISDGGTTRQDIRLAR